MNRKGLAAGLIAIIVVSFLFAIVSLFAIFAWNEFDTAIQDTDNATIDQFTKDKVASLGFIVGWADKLFIFFFVALLIGYLISSVTLPVDRPIFLIIFMVFLIMTTIVAALLSNAWEYIINEPNFVAAAADLKFTDFFMRYFPMIVFLIGLIGAVIFYGRRNVGGGFNSGGGDKVGFE